MYLTYKIDYICSDCGSKHIKRVVESYPNNPHAGAKEILECLDCGHSRIVSTTKYANSDMNTPWIGTGLTKIEF